MLPESEIRDRFVAVRDCITDALARSRRDAESCRLVLATKTQPLQAVRAAYNAGARDFGENYVQEAVPKHQALSALSDISWHLIGHLQSNKAAAAINNFALIHTLDRARLAATLQRLQPGPPIPVLLEINLAAEASKTGIAPANAEALITQVRTQVEVRGLMTIPPPSIDSAQTRAYFVQLRELRDRLVAASDLPLPELSMGMTDDYIIAIEEGATIVRVGRAIFGART